MKAGTIIVSVIILIILIMLSGQQPSQKTTNTKTLSNTTKNSTILNASLKNHTTNNIIIPKSLNANKIGTSCSVSGTVYVNGTLVCGNFTMVLESIYNGTVPYYNIAPPYVTISISPLFSEQVMPIHVNNSFIVGPPDGLVYINVTSLFTSRPQHAKIALTIIITHSNRTTNG